MSTYETDFYRWTHEQAAAIRAGRFNELDLQNIAEELESMGRSEKRALDSRLTVLLAHLLKWRHQPARRGKSWQLTIKGQRLAVVDVLDDNPGLAAKLPEILAHAYRRAVINASSETGLDEELFAADCPWTFDQIVDAGFFPE